MLRLTRELVNQGFDSRRQLLDLLMQINLMESYATLQGVAIEKELGRKLAQLSGLVKRPADGRDAADELKTMDDDSVVKAIEIAFEVHGSLSGLVKPATPESLEASAPRAGLARITWPRVTDVMIATTFVAVFTFALGALLKLRWPNAEQLAYLGAALLGASFSGLFTAYKFVQNRTFDPASGSSYMVRVVLGTVSGLILANIGGLLIQQTGGGGEPNKILAALGPGTLALVGGYSADAVNLILQRIADALVTTVRGNPDDVIKAKQTQLEDVIKAKWAQLQAEAKTAEFEQRQATVVALSDMLKNTTDETLKDNLQMLMAAVGQGNVGAEILKPVKTNGNGRLDLSGESPKPVDSVAANSEAVKAAQNGSNGDAVLMAPVETSAPVSDPRAEAPVQDVVSVGADEPPRL